MPTGDYNSTIQWIEWFNSSGSDIPAWSILRVTGSRTRFGRVTLEMGQPNTYGSQYSHFVNADIDVPAGGYGMCALPVAVPMFALYDSADTSPALGARIGPRSGTHKLKASTGGFRIVSATALGSGATHRVLVVQQPMLHFVGKTDASHAKSATGTVSIWAGTHGSESDTTINMASVYNRFADLDSGVWVRAEWNEVDEKWDLVAGEC